MFLYVPSRFVQLTTFWFGKFAWSLKILYRAEVRSKSFLQAYSREKASAILRVGDHNIAQQAMEAAIKGGFRIVEFTLTIPGAYRLIESFSQRKDVIVGAGTVLKEEQAQCAIDSGASYLVSPIVDEKVIAVACDQDVAMMPGCHTPTEMVRAYRAGASLQKLFPAPAGGPSYLRALLGPLPFLHVVPTQGVEETNIREWLDAGAFALGFVSSLFQPEDLRNENYEAITARARRMMSRVSDFSNV